MELTSKQRAYLKSLAMDLDPSFNVGKESLTPGVTSAVDEALEANELIKIGVLKNCQDDPREIAEMIAERTHSITVQVIGKKMIFYRQAKKSEDRKIVLPKAVRS
ncbi:MAG: ribosome assembly RNA-binding protein YhbY [Lachnospiraceae bacterium]|nr:ribosome assembly RNA-binding protein YhbY [Lachnospiraceae bacterium]